MKVLKTVRPDPKGRITLGNLASGISKFNVLQDKQNRIILIPFVEIPAQEKWLFANKSAMQQVQQGLKDSAAGNTEDLGSFSQYIEKNPD